MMSATATDVCLDVVVGGGARDRLLYTVQDLGLAHRIELHEPAERGALVALLQRADLFVLPSLENRPWPELMEAMAAGLPAVVTDLPCLRATGGPDVVYVPPGEPRLLASTLVDLLQDTARLRAMGAAVRQRAVNELPDEASTCRELLKALRGVRPRKAP
jgi:glycosyltransferase involved in cell wall biosynthesis